MQDGPATRFDPQGRQSWSAAKTLTNSDLPAAITTGRDADLTRGEWADGRILLFLSGAGTVGAENRLERADLSTRMLVRSRSTMSLGAFGGARFRLCTRRALARQSARDATLEEMLGLAVYLARWVESNGTGGRAGSLICPYSTCKEVEYGGALLSSGRAPVAAAAGPGRPGRAPSIGLARSAPLVPICAGDNLTGRLGPARRLICSGPRFRAARSQGGRGPGAG